VNEQQYLFAGILNILRVYGVELHRKFVGLRAAEVYSAAAVLFMFHEGHD